MIVRDNVDMSGRTKFYTSLIALIGIWNVYYHWRFISTTLWTPIAKYYVKDQNVIVAFTTTPYRIANIKPTLECLNEQIVQPKHVYLSIPHIFKRDNSEYNIPEWLQKYPNLTILRTQDYGPATKILGLLEQVKVDPDTIIVTIDDDTCYVKNLLLNLVYSAKRFPNDVIGSSGGSLNFGPKAESGLLHVLSPHSKVEFLEGVTGIAYRAKFFDQAIFSIQEEPSYCYNSDDLYLAFYLAKKHINRRIMRVTGPYTAIATNYTISYNTDALHKLSENQADRYQKCYSYLEHKYPNVAFKD